MGWTILGFFVFCIIIAWAGVASESQKEKEKQKKIKEEREWYEREKKQQEQVRREIEWQAEMRLKEKKKKGMAEFKEKLDQIPLAEIRLSDHVLTEKSAFLSDDITTIKPRKGARRSIYGDFTVVDVETTGLSSLYDEIIEISAIKYRNYAPVSAFTSLIKPASPIPEKITEITHINNSMVESAPTISQVIPSFVEFMGQDNILAHNIKFDLGFLHRAGFDFLTSKRRYYDTLEIARAKLTKADVENYKLTTLCDHFEIYRDDAHRSLSDCFATGELYKKLVNLYDLQWT